MAGDQTTKVFISYSRKDRAFVGRLVDALEAANDIEVFRDTDDILPTEEWKDRLEQLIGEADTVVFALSPHSAKSEICSWEVEHALSLNKRIAPIVIKDVDGADIPGPLSKLNYIFFTNRKEFDASISNLITALNTDIDWIREHTRLGELARRWDGQGRPKSQKLRGGDLSTAENWLALQPANAPQPGMLHREYIQASRLAARRRQQGTVSGSMAAAIIAIVLAGFALIQQRAAERERDRAVIAEQSAEAALRAATDTANGLIFNLAQEFRNSGVPSATIARILAEARKLQDALIGDNIDDQELLQSKAAAINEIVATLLAQGDTVAAVTAARESLVIDRMLLELDPENTQAQRGVSVSLVQIGDILRVTGDTAGAMKAFEEVLAIARALVARDRENTRWQHDLSVSLTRIGDIRLATGDRAGALLAFEESLAIDRSLVARDPENTQWQRGLSVSLERLARHRAATGDTTGALQVYEESLAIARELAARDPDNTQWQRDVSVSLQQVGDLLVATGDAAGALQAFEESLAIRRALLARDTENVQWQRDVSASLTKVGDIYDAAGDSTGALQAFEESLAIARALMADDPDFELWQRDVRASLAKVGDVLVARGDLAGALPVYEERIAMARTLLAGDPENTDWQWDISTSLNKVGDNRVATGDYDGALAAFEESLAILLVLTERDPQNMDWQRDVWISHWRIASVTENQEYHWQQIVEILTRLDGAGQLSEEDQQWLPAAQENLAAVTATAQ
jgi:tetratricopeptide (TPR) repeat protein